MTNRHSLFCTALTLATVTAANADLNYDSVSLIAEAYCEHTQDLRSSNAPSMQEQDTMSASCGATDVTSYFNKDENGFVLGAGSTGPNSNPRQANGHPGHTQNPQLSDNSMGFASVEIELSVDQFTYFSMYRSLVGSTVEIWEGDTMVHSFQQVGDQGGLAPGSYLFKMENNPYEAPAWAQISFEQTSGVAGDLDNNGILDQNDLVKMIGQLDDDQKVLGRAHKIKKHNATNAKRTHRGRCGTEDPQDTSASEHGCVARKPSGPRTKPESGPTADERGSKGPDFSNCTPMDKLPSSMGKDGKDNIINAGKGSEEYSRPVNSIERLQGDMDGDGKVTMKDVAKLLERL